MFASSRAGFVAGLLLAAAAPLAGQSPLFVLDLQGTALDEFPSGVKALNGTMTTVDKNGQRMLRASSPSEFLIQLPQNLPAAFTVIVDLIPKACCNPEDFMLEGTPSRSRGVASAELTWKPAHIMAVGGGGAMYQSDMPADLAATTPGNLTQLIWEFNGTTIKHYTNGRRMYTLDKQFVRGRVLRVWLGGQDEGLHAVHLAGLSVLDGAVASGVIASTGLTGGGGNNSGQLTSLKPQSNPVPTVNPPQQQTAQSQQGLNSRTSPAMAPTVTQGAAGPLVQWSPLKGVTGYTVRRWKIDDLTCCNNASGTLGGSPWQDAALTVPGTYVYEVTAIMPSSSLAEETQFAMPAPIPIPVPMPPSTGTIIPTTTSATPVISPPIAAQTGTPVRTATAPPPGSPAAVALAPTGPPPTNISVTGTPVIAQLNWASPVSGLRGVTYKVDRWLESNPTCCTGQSATLTFPAWTDEGVQWPGTYVFKITAFLPDGTWGEATTRWVKPDPVNPTNFRAASVSAGFVALRWDAVPNASWYELSGPGLGYPTFQATSGAFNVHNLAPGTYTWRVGTFYSSPNAPAPVSGPASAFPSVTVTVP